MYGGITADLVLVPFTADLVLVPYTTAYYTYQTYTRAGWLGPTVMFIYFLVSTVINKMLMASVVNLAVKIKQL